MVVVRGAWWCVVRGAWWCVRSSCVSLLVMLLCPYFHFFVSLLCDFAASGCADEFGGESEEFFVCVFHHFCDDL